MRTISVRKLNETMRDLKEPVEVVVQPRKSGQYTTLGYFFPKGTIKIEEGPAAPAESK